MGEVGMSLLFKNVGSSTAGKGDLSINGEEFEIKGEGATLGEKPILLSNSINDKLGPFGIKVLGGRSGIEFDGKKYAMNQFSNVIADAYNSTENKSFFTSIADKIH